jgi:AbiV family abortive infection protein
LSKKATDDWTIPDEKIADGYGLSLKNAKKILGIARDLFNKKEYAVSIFLAVIAIEELGKGILLMQKRDEPIDNKYWDKNFLHHLPKALASVNSIREVVKQDDPERHNKLQKLNELEQYLREHEIKKLDALYLDWNPERNDWDYYDEQMESVKQKEASLILSNAEWLVTGYLQDGQIITERVNVVLEMVRVGLAYAHCKNCDLRMNNLAVLLQHRKQFSNHEIDFREN